MFREELFTIEMIKLITAIDKIIKYIKQTFLDIWPKSEFGSAGDSASSPAIFVIISSISLNFSK